MAIAIQIGEAAKRTSLSIDAIRFYERRALLPKPDRTEGRFRLYTEDDLLRLQFIREMQSLGFSLNEIVSRGLVNEEASVFEFRWHSCCCLPCIGDS
jgi:MerR HTH family regulatory protein